MPLTWTDEFDCGVATINEQHQHLVGLLNTLEQMITFGIASGPEVDRLLDDLASDMTKHFSFEEGCMMKHQCPAAEENQEAHNQFLGIFAGFQSEIEKHGSSTALLKRLHETAVDWIVAHILNVDVQLKPCVH